MAIQPALFLPEEILLLALRDDTGTIPFGSMYGYAVGGAVLAELIVRGRIELVGPEKKRLVQLVDPKPVGEALLDESLARIASAKRRGSLTTWVTRLAGAKNLRNRLAEGLCRRGILRADEKEILLFFKRRTFPMVNPEPEARLVERIRAAIFEDDEVDPRTVVLLSLVDNARLLPLLFDRKALRPRRARIKALVQREPLGKAVKDAIAAAESAVVIMP